jgi:hypothetical protein
MRHGESKIERGTKVSAHDLSTTGRTFQWHPTIFVW